MDGYKEFQGKTLDDAIREASSYFDAPREKLEIDIVQDAKSGVFGLIGARKAKVRARRVQLKTTVEELVGRGREARAPREEAAPAVEKAPRAEKPAREEKPRREGSQPRETAQARDGAQPRDDASRDKPRRGRPIDAAPEKADRSERGEKAEKSEKSEEERQPRDRRRSERGRRDARPQREKRTAEAAPESVNGGEARSEAPSEEGEGRTERTGRRRRRGGRGRGRSQNGERSEQARPESQRAPEEVDVEELGMDIGDTADDAAPEGLPEIPLEQLDQEQVRAVALEVTGRLVTPVIGEAALSVDLADGRIKVTVDCGENSGLLIGREGQTLASLQYLASRIVARKLGAAVRVQLDTGDYRERQDEKLRDLAIGLAEKVRATGKPQSTRPLSSYHRRVVHLALQEDEDIVTRSKGDGPLKRVIILKRRKTPAA